MVHKQQTGRTQVPPIHMFTPMIVKLLGFLSQLLLVYVQILGERIKCPFLLLVQPLPFDV